MKKYKKLSTVILVICFIFVGCKAKQEDFSRQQVTNETKLEEMNNSTEDSEAIVEENKDTGTEFEEITEEPVEESELILSLEEYIDQLDSDEICAVVWNESSNRHEKFVEDQKCIVKEGDIVVVPVGKRPIVSVYYNDVSQEYNEEEGYFIVNVENPKWMAISITYKTGEEEYNNICIPTKKEE